MENRDPTLCVYRVLLPLLPPMNSLPSYLFRSRFAPFQIGFSCIHHPLLVPPVITPPPRMSSCGNRFIRLCSRERRGICTSRQVENVNTRVLDSWTADIKLSDQWNICNDGRREKELFAKFVVASRMVDRFLFEFECDARCVLFYFPPLFNDNVQI